MDITTALTGSLLTPIVLAFVLGVIAALVRSDLELPKDFYAALTIYLLFAIGLKGGAKLSEASISEFLPPLIGALGLGVAIPLWCYALLRKFARFSSADSAALAAHFGSVSAVTFGAVIAFLDTQKIAHEPFLPALLAVLEIPAILVAIYLYKRNTVANSDSAPIGAVMREMLTGKSIVLLAGGMLIGILSGKQGFSQVAPVFEAPFRGVLCLFLLELGLVTGSRLGDLRAAGGKLICFALAMPVLHGFAGVWVGSITGLGIGGSTVMGTLAASASYIAAPAAVRIAIPDANPTLYLTGSLAVTFPFNVTVGIPLYYWFAQWLVA